MGEGVLSAAAAAAAAACDVWMGLIKGLILRRIRSSRGLVLSPL